MREHDPCREAEGELSPEGEILYQSALNDFHIVDAGPGLFTVKITTTSGVLRSRYPTSEEMDSHVRALHTATKIAVKDLGEMDPEEIKEVLRKRNPKK